MIAYIHLRCISHASENLEKVKKAMEFISGEKKFNITKKRGYYGNEIFIIEVTIKNKKKIKNFWLRLKSIGIVDEIINISDEIMDEHGNVYLRFDKQEAYLGRLAIISHGDVIAMRAKVQSYPMKKEKALENFRTYLNSL